MAVVESDDDLGLFLCPRMPGGLRLMPASCAEHYRRGKRAEAWETDGHCRGCEIGARNAGEALVFVPPIGHECKACGSPSRRLVFGLVCVSCFNRLAEAIRGRNARGQQPRKWSGMPVGDQVAVVHGRLVFVGRGRVRLIARAPTVMVGPQWSLLDAAVGRQVELPAPVVFRVPVRRHGRRRVRLEQWPLFD